MRHTREELFTAATVLPVGLQEAADYCKVDDVADYGRVESALYAAVELVESLTRRALLSQVWDVYYEDFSRELILPRPKLISITSVKYYDQNQVLQTLASTVYESASKNGIFYVRRKFSQTWPATRGHRDDVVVRQTVGYGTTAASVPYTLRLAVKMLTLHLMDNPGIVIAGGLSEIPWSIRNLLAPYMITQTFGGRQ